MKHIAKHRANVEPIKHGVLRYRGEHEALSYDEGPRRCSTCGSLLPDHRYSEHAIGFRGAA